MPKNPFNPTQEVDEATYQQLKQDYDYGVAQSTKKPQPKANMPKPVEPAPTPAAQPVATTETQSGPDFGFQDLNDIWKEYSTDQLFMTSEQAKNDFNALKKMQEGLGILTPEKEAQLKMQAEAAAASQFDPLIAEAEKAKKYGMPKATIYAGQKGGFESTQMAGAAALTPTEGGDFAGAGGSLEQIKSVYDTNISNLKVQKAQFYQASLSAFTAAEKSGQQSAFDNAMKLYDKAQEMNSQAISLANQKLQAFSSLETIKQSKVKQAQDEIKTLAGKGINLDQFSPEQITEMEQTAGFMPGTFKQQYEALGQDYQQEQDLLLFSKGLDILQAAQGLEEGKEYKIPGTDVIIKGIAKKADPDVLVVETVVNGQIQEVGINKLDGTVLWKMDTGQKYKAPGSGSGGGAANKAGVYFSAPKPDGSIGYYFGDPKKVDEAQELTPENYLKGKSTSEGVVTPDGLTPEEDKKAQDIVTQGAKLDIDSALNAGNLDTQEGYNEVQIGAQQLINENQLDEVHAQELLNYLEQKVSENNPKGANLGKFKGKG